MSNRIPVHRKRVFPLLVLSFVWILLFSINLWLMMDTIIQAKIGIVLILTAFAFLNFGLFLSVLALTNRQGYISRLEEQLNKISSEHIEELGEINRNLLQEIHVRKQLEQLLRNSLDESKLFAETDVLTGVYNRRAVVEYAKTEYQRCVKNCQPISFFMIDMDNLKQINDQNGHLAGDKAIQFLARTLAQVLRKVDGIGRWGGDEFLVVLSETDQEIAAVIANRIVETMNAINLDEIGAPDITLAVSLGISSYTPEELGGERVHFDDLLQQADEALYKAKNDGKNRAIIHQTASKRVPI